MSKTEGLYRAAKTCDLKQNIENAEKIADTEGSLRITEAAASSFRSDTGRKSGMKGKTGGKAEQNKKAKRDALTSAAFELFTSQGINKTSIADIANRAKVAKGTFYLYFSDKYDIRNFLISSKAGVIFRRAAEAYEKNGEDMSFEDEIIFFVSNIIDQFSADPSIVRFLSKNLSWGIFKHDLNTVPIQASDGIDFHKIYIEAVNNSNAKYKDPEVMLFMIIELVGSSSYSAILFKEPMSMQDLKPYLLDAVRGIMRSQEIPESAS